MEYPLQREKIPQSRPNPFWDVLCDPDRKAIAVELDPPEGADLSKFMTGARELRAKDVDIITIADCPVARVRVDSSLMACKLHRELGMSALPHMTCRDRNLNATQALLLGLCAEGIGNVLVVTGDPIPNASRDEVKSRFPDPAGSEPAGSGEPDARPGNPERKAAWWDHAGGQPAQCIVHEQ